MKWVVLIFFLPIFAFGQRDVSSRETFEQSLQAFLSTDNASISTEAFRSHIDKLQTKREAAKSELNFLRMLFSRTHEKFLKRFDEYASFAQTINKGEYNCLTASATYGLLLHHFNLDYDIVETNYHMFILVNTVEGTVLLETTDPVNGFITDQKEIETRIKKYKSNAVRDEKDNYYRLSCSVYKHVALEELTGLLHYNLAIKAFNHHDLQNTIEHLDKATAIYCSPRMEELTRIVLLSIIESKQNDQFKEESVRRIQVLRKRNLNALASR
ncbi:hypothetical protein [Pseudochryseolinea flava]|uniref:Protein SirB1 N-terminal domain-containing protein n=1 Tax=Pseudochryseolinea flava TaxID=2059302 RepID=A0A364Y9W3_9BACT|nr:hypothetical protein [Pseudochryseolinea flava]RAW03225.1 hypothetical protein DQQ10_03830 [Pseudochryseolinea flava]